MVPRRCMARPLDCGESITALVTHLSQFNAELPDESVVAGNTVAGLEL